MHRFIFDYDMCDNILFIRLPLILKLKIKDDEDHSYLRTINEFLRVTIKDTAC